MVMEVMVAMEVVMAAAMVMEATEVVMVAAMVMEEVMAVAMVSFTFLYKTSYI